MLDDKLIRSCSPTLAGLKTGNIFCVEFEDICDLKKDIRSVNKRLREKGIRALPLRIRESRALIYVYRVGRLKKDLCDEAAAKLLAERGYDPHKTSRCIGCLIRRINLENDFPHEIGLFIGYPPEDVRGFMENNAKECKCVGCWKVYGDETKARRTFAQYKKCKDIYMKKWRDGASIERLTVAV